MRYFDKTFFRFTLGFLVIVVISLLVMYAASAYAAGVDKIVFTTDSQSVKPNILSGPITIQTQDSGSNTFQTPETIDLEFLSSSPTGNFLGSTGNPVTTYMSKNTANKTFYYKDSTEGTYTITINAKGRDTGEEWSSSQQIIISSGATQNNDQDSGGEVLSANTESSTDSQSLGGSTTIVSSLNSQLEIIAGNDRMASPGSPIWFQATVKKNTTKTSVDLDWSFGDGNVGTGPLVSHTYKYPGDYLVVLSARAGDIFSVSRLKVKVLVSNIEVLNKEEYLEIINKSNAEINIFNWKLENNGKAFIFQPNTIILPKSSIKIDKNLLNMKGYGISLGISLKNSLGEEVFSAATIGGKDLEEISKNIEEVKSKAIVIQDKINGLEFVARSNQSLANTFSAVSVNKTEDKDQIATDTDDFIYEAPKTESFVVKLTNFIKRVFSD